MVKYLDRFNIIDLTEVDFKIGTCSGATISEFEVWGDVTLAEPCVPASSLERAYLRIFDVRPSMAADAP